MEVWDAVVNQRFTLHAMLMTTISDNAAHRNLFGQSKRKGSRLLPLLVRDMFLVATELKQICIHGPQTMASEESPVPKHKLTV